MWTVVPDHGTVYPVIFSSTTESDLHSMWVLKGMVWEKYSGSTLKFRTISIGILRISVFALGWE
jgi:hypothetical protein